MSIGSVSNSTDSAPSIGMQSCMQVGRLAGSAQDGPLLRLRNDNQDALAGRTLPKLTLEEFVSLEDFDEKDAQFSPAQAIKTRLSGRINPQGGWPTLQNYLISPGLDDAADPTFCAKAQKLPKPHALLAVYCIPCGGERTKYGVVMPGNYVAISKSLARMMAQVSPNVPVHMNSTMVYPDELVYQGHAYGFVYVPRSVQNGFERYQADLRRTLFEEKMSMQRRMCASEVRAAMR